MLIDTHLHESKYSLDSRVSLEEIVERAREIGLDGVCITDHESSEIKNEARELSESTGFLIIVGAEILTFEGDMTIFGLPKLPDKMLHARDLVELVQAHSGAAISAHPYRKNHRGMGDHMRALKGLSGIEAFNGSTKLYQNLYAYELSQGLMLPALGGSDAHVVSQVGKYATYFPGLIRDERDFIEAVRSKQAFPAIYEEGAYSIIDDYSKIHRYG